MTRNTPYYERLLNTDPELKSDAKDLLSHLGVRELNQLKKEFSEINFTDN